MMETGSNIACPLADQFRRCFPMCFLLFTIHSLVDAPAAEWKDIRIMPSRIAEPALNLTLFPVSTERVPGNAATILLRMTSVRNAAAWDALAVNSRNFLEQGLAEFSVADARNRTLLWDYATLRHAAYCKTANWEYEEGPNGPSDTAIDLTAMSSVSDLLCSLAVHCRADIIDGKYMDAIDKITVGFGIIDHVGECAYTLPRYIQIRNANAFLDRVQELQQQPSAPNLYWAISQLPYPLIDVRKTISWERTSLQREIGAGEIAAISDEDQWKEVRLQLERYVYDVHHESWGEIARHPELRREKLKVDIETARRQLRELSPSLETRVEEMGDDEVLSRWFFRCHQIEMDRALRGALLPPPEGLRCLNEASERLWKMDELPDYARQIPAMCSLYADAWAVCRRLDMLRIVEALRDYAARHHGNLPKTLAEVRDPPIPADVLTGRDYDYHTESGIGYLRAQGIAVRGKTSHALNYRVLVTPTQQESSKNREVNRSQPDETDRTR